jgi:hypothetical protein
MKPKRSSANAVKTLLRNINGARAGLGALAADLQDRPVANYVATRFRAKGSALTAKYVAKLRQQVRSIPASPGRHVMPQTPETAPTGARFHQPDEDRFRRSSRGCAVETVSGFSTGGAPGDPGR